MGRACAEGRASVGAQLQPDVANGAGLSRVERHKKLMWRRHGVNIEEEWAAAR